MRWSIRNQIMLPVALLVLAAVLGTSLTTAWLAARQSERHSFRQFQTIVETLRQSPFPLSPQVLENLKGLSGAEFVAVNSEGTVTEKTVKDLPEATREQLNRLPKGEEIQQLSQLPKIAIGERNHLVAKIATPYGRLFVLYPEGRLREAQYDAVFAPLLVGAIAGGLGLILSAGLAHRLARHIRGVREQLTLLSQRHFVQIEPAGPVDELFELQSAANRLSQRLSQLETEIVHSERLRLLAQLAGGISHHLRNAVTGARLAIQLHRRRCAANANDESLDVAERQLSLTEEQIKGILALGIRQRVAQKSGDIAQLAAEVQRLMEPLAKHVDVRFEAQFDLPPGTGIVDDADAVRAAIVNLVSNAIEAAGTQGEVILRTAETPREFRLEVADSGSGPRNDLQTTLFEPFITSKSEGVGLGLFLARQAAESTGGTITWERQSGHTVFRLGWPSGAATLKSEVSSHEGLPEPSTPKASVS